MVVVYNFQLAKCRKYQSKKRVVQSLILKDRKGNTLSYLNDELIDQDPDRASLCAIRKHMNCQPINYARDLFSIAQYDQGHYLIYDNKEVFAYTVISPY